MFFCVCVMLFNRSYCYFFYYLDDLCVICIFIRVNVIIVKFVGVGIEIWLVLVKNICILLDVIIIWLEFSRVIVLNSLFM